MPPRKMLYELADEKFGEELLHVCVLADFEIVFALE